jgi:HAD superfamily hydrolase (TIGR01509 family)
MEAVILDLDGTLIDSNDAHALTFEQALSQYGVTSVPYKGLRQMIGMSGMAILCRVLDEQTFQTHGEAIDAEHLKRLKDLYQEEIQPFPGVQRLMETLQAQRRRIVLCTASPPDLVDYFIDKMGIGAYLDGVTTSEDVPVGKPDPLPIAVCCQKFNLSTQRTLMIGDSPYDVLAATQYEVPTIGILTGGYSEADLLNTGALSVFNDLNALTEALLQHPLATPR